MPRWQLPVPLSRDSQLILVLTRHFKCQRRLLSACQSPQQLVHWSSVNVSMFISNDTTGRGLVLAAVITPQLGSENHVRNLLLLLNGEGADLARMILAKDDTDTVAAALNHVIDTSVADMMLITAIRTYIAKTARNRVFV